jgi:hypothetical protein
MIIEGIGLGEASAIKFEGEGVAGEVEGSVTDELNSPIYVDVRVDASAPLGPRHFTLITPEGEVSSGDVVLIVEEPKITAFIDNSHEGAPGSRGLISIMGIGLDDATEISFSGTGVTGKVLPLGHERFFLNPSVAVELTISASAPLGERVFTIMTSHGPVTSGDVKFRVVNPRITGVIVNCAVARARRGTYTSSCWCTVCSRRNCGRVV